MSGRKYLIYLSSDGTSVGPMVEVEFQGNLRVNEGRAMTRTPYKNGSKSSHGRQGFSGSFEMGVTAPLPTGQALVMQHYDAETSCYAEIKTADTGGFVWEGPLKFGIEEFPANTDGEFNVTVQFGEDGNVTRGVVA